MGKRFSSLAANGGFGCAVMVSTLETTRFWMKIWSAWVISVGHCRRFCTLRKSSSVTLPSRSGWARILAVATASWTARLMPTPPMGDMAWAASPMHSSPGAYQRFKRSTATVSSFTSSHEAISRTRVRKLGVQRDNGQAEGLKPFAAQFIEAALGDDEGALPIIAAVDHDEEAAGLDTAEAVGAIVGAPGQTQPQYVHGRAAIFDLEAGKLAHRGVAAIGADHKIGAHLQIAFRGGRFQAHDSVAVLQKLVDLRLHAQMKGRIALARLGQKIEELPLRHEGEKFAVGREMREIGDLHQFITDLRAELAHLLVRPLEELVDQAELIHELERRGMDGVAAEVAEEVLVLFQHDHIDAGPGQEKAQHDARRSAAGNRAMGGDGLGRHSAQPHMVMPGTRPGIGGGLACNYRLKRLKNSMGCKAG